MNTATRRKRLLIAFAFEAGLGVLALGVSALLGHRLLDTVLWSWTGAIAGILGTVPLVLVFVGVRRSSARSLVRLAESVRHMVRAFFKQLSLPEAALLSLAAGVGEELLFRGLLQEGLGAVTGMPWLGFTVATFAFGAVHWHSATYFLYTAALGVVLGILYWVTGDLLAPIICHALYDTVALYLSQRPLPTPPGSARHALRHRDRRPPGGSAE